MNERANVLIVDDSPVNLQILADALRSDYQVKVATNGIDALRIAERESRPDLVLLDVMMPEIDGFEVCRRLKANPRTQNIPVIFVTAKSDEIDEELGLNLGAIDYITKPFSIPITKARIRNHLRLKRQADLLEFTSMVDALTGIPNRRRFDEVSEAECRRAERESTPLSFLMVDIDHFKEYNDHYGHGAGDVCLQAVANALAHGVSRPTDLVARYGGEEFVVILPDTDMKAAQMIAERLRKSVQEMALRHDFSGADHIVTVSIGGATKGNNIKAASASLLMEEADRLLYHAKEAGRNKVCFSASCC
jgi:diguanylate cyclase (GGDEF)-like protein